MSDFKYLAVNDWEEYQTSIRNREWIKDSVGQSDRSKFASLSFFERGLLQEIRRVRGRTGMNIENDIAHIALATHAKATDRPHIRHAIDTLIAQRILVLTNEQHTPLEERRGDKRRGDIEAEPDITKPAPKKTHAVPPEASSGLKAVMLLPLNSGDEFAVTEPDCELWKKTYPAVNVPAELQKMATWLHCNPTRKKTRGGVKKFINSWLSRAQDNPKGAAMLTLQASRDGPTVDATATIRERQEKLKAFRASNGQN